MSNRNFLIFDTLLLPFLAFSLGSILMSGLTLRVTCGRGSVPYAGRCTR